MEQQSSSRRSGCRLRRPHQKSRNGCLTCKQRRIKCDEKRPSCFRCEESLRTCIYATDQHSPAPSESAATSRSSIPSPTPSLSGPFSSLSTRSRGPSPAPLTAIRAFGEIESGDVITNFTDADLYHHFLNHTCKSPPQWHKDRVVLQVGIAKLAFDSEPVSHSILALSAACLCRDTISKGNADPRTVRQILDIGLQHHTLALEQMQTMMSCPDESEIEPLMANALMLVPFAFALQYIDHWVLSGEGSQGTNSVTPRDAVLLLRGIKTTIMALNSSRASRKDESRSSQSNTHWHTIFLSQITDSSTLTTTPGRSQPMFPVLAATCHQALSQLQRRMESALASSQLDESMASTFNAYDILKDIISSTFSISECTEDSLKHVTYVSLDPDSLLAQMPSWLQNYVLRPPLPSQTEPLYRLFLTFFSGAPDAYIDLLLPLLDPQSGDGPNHHKLTASEVLALDVYAHWLVLLFLVENEAWWMGDFPVVALLGLITRYGDEFLDTSSNPGQWWPVGMLEVVTRLKQWK